MAENLRDAIRIAEIVKDKRSRLKVTYKGIVYEDIKDFMVKFNIIEKDFIKLKRIGCSTEVSLLFLLKDLYILNRSLNTEIKLKLAQ